MQLENVGEEKLYLPGEIPRSHKRDSHDPRIGPDHPSWCFGVSAQMTHDCGKQQDDFLPHPCTGVRETMSQVQDARAAPALELGPKRAGGARPVLMEGVRGGRGHEAEAGGQRSLAVAHPGSASSVWGTGFPWPAGRPRPLGEPRCRESPEASAPPESPGPRALQLL